MKPGAKYYEWEGRGVPLRLEVGPRDVASGTVVLARRTGGKKESLPMDGLAERAASTPWTRCRPICSRRPGPAGRPPRMRGATKEQFIARMEGDGGFVYAGYCGAATCEAEIKEQTKATIRVLAGRGVPLAGGARPPACGAGGRAWPRPCGRRRTEAGRPERAAGRGCLDLFADAGLERRAARCPGRRVARPRSPSRSERPPIVYNAEAIRSRYRTLDAGPRRRCRTGSATRSRPTATSRCSGFCGTWARAPTSSRGGELLARARRRVPRPTGSCSAGWGRRAEELRAAVEGRHRAISTSSRARSSSCSARSPSRRQRKRSRSASGSIPTSPPIPIPTSRPARAGSSSGSRSTRWCRPPSTSLRHPQLELDHHRHAPGEPAPRSRALRRGHRPAARAGRAGASGGRRLP